MAELWQMATRWLSVLKVLPPESPALKADARVYDLALALQDGTVLCNAVNVIQPDTITLIHQKPEKQFLKMQNINSFLAALNQFGIKPDELFTADELYYASDFAKVIASLSRFSKTQICGLAGIRFFPEDNRPEVTDRADDGEGEDMYQTLEDLVGQSLSLEEAAASAAAYDPDPDEGEEEKIYGSIENVIGPGGKEVYADLLYSEGEGENIYGRGVNTPDEKRNCVLAELHDTEKNYVKVLRAIIDTFMKTLSSQQKIITRSDCKTIFSNITDLLVAHVEFLDLLDKQMSNKTGRIISEVFLVSIKSFRCYGIFCCEIPDAIAKLKELAAKPQSAKLMDQARKDSGQRFPLKDLLNVPMQRVLKYPLLLKELIKNTPETHPDKAALAQALAAVQDLAKFINDTKKDHDNLKNMVASLKQYVGKPLQEFGSLVKDGDLMHKTESPRDKLKLRYIFLFSKALVFCKSKGVFYHFKETAEFDAEQELVDVAFWSLPKDEQNNKYAYVWSLKSKRPGGETHVFAAKSLPAKKKWMTAMQQSLDLLKDAKAPSVTPRSASGSDDPDGPMAAPRGSASRVSASAPGKKQLEVPKAGASGKGGPPAAQSQSKGYEVWAVGPPPTTAAPLPTPLSPGLATSPSPSEDGDFGFAESSEENWYAGRMPRAKADKILTSGADGSYLVRESDSRPGDYSLSVKFGIVKHIKINRHGNKYDLAPDAKSFPSIQELVAHFQKHSLNRHFPGMETTLAIPFKDAATRGGQPRTVAAASSAAQGIGRARSRFAYKAKSHDELSFERGVEICILSMEDQDPGWWKGSLPNGQVGIFPSNYVASLG